MRLLKLARCRYLSPEFMRNKSMFIREKLAENLASKISLCTINLKLKAAAN